ncbi:uncharacterized protein TM35_000241130 [Trypanosoma theileri]|uniref:FHA domain-containing protein n=1 Tax=Trypanosoma theileri TaxID=67003 RepID=A0A1X0NR44_9TRYP|nr:uncharacterized protein TM35_000241130 [Trypanosoma theileri]ORC86963.1 hypothetical protein TM35_000241130 [Trypanosoma theileri]
MVRTSFRIAASDKSVPYLSGTKDFQYLRGKEALLSGITKETATGAFVLAVSNAKDNGKSIMKSLCSHFAESFTTPIGSYKQFSISFIDESAGDLLQYRCDRITDIDAIIEEEQGRHRCCSLKVSVVHPTSSSFDFSDIHLTVLIWNEGILDHDFVRATERVASVFETRIVSIYVYLESMNASLVKQYIGMVYELRAACETRVFGVDQRVSSHVRLQEVRAWSIFLNEFEHFAPQSEGPYFINLNPKLVVGEKLAHAISKGSSYIVAEESNSSFVDFVVFPLGNTKEGVGHRSIYSPHCRLTYEKGIVCIRPECGMTYVNGQLLSSEIVLRHNDRIVLGKEMAFRFVMVSDKMPLTSSSRILDWELCCKEFDYVTSNTVKQAECNQLERDLSQLKEDYEVLYRQLQIERGSDDKAWLILNNPPSDYTASFVWHLGWMKVGDSITLGPKGDIDLSFLNALAVISRTNSGFIYNCGSVSLKLTHCHRFLNGDSIFSVCLKPVVSDDNVRTKNKVSAGKELEVFSDDDICELRNRLFELQWSITLLFDFAFPQEKARSGGSSSDPYHVRRTQMSNDDILTSSKFKLQNVAHMAEKMTEAIRMIGFQLMNEINNGISTTKRDTCMIEDGENATKELLKQINNDTKLSHDLLLRVQQLVGRMLIEGDTQGWGNKVQSGSPLKIKNFGNISCNDLKTRIMNVRAKCFCASPELVRRMGNTLDVLSGTSDPNMLWERYLKVLDALTRPYTDVSTAVASKRQGLVYALVDVLVALDYTVRGGLLTEEGAGLEARLPAWEAIADFVPAAFPPRPSRRPTPRAASRPTSRPATPRDRPAGHTRPADPARRAASSGKSPRTLRSLTPTGATTRTNSKSAGLRSTPTSPRVGERAVGVGSTAPRLGAISAVQRTLRGTTVVGAGRATPQGGARAVSPKSPLLRGTLDDLAIGRKKKKALDSG